MPHEIDEQLRREGVDIFSDEPRVPGLDRGTIEVAEDFNEPEALGPMTEEEAEEYLRQRNHLEHEIATIKAQALAKLSPLRAELGRLNWLHEHRLEQYVRAQAEATGKKTFPFWNGTCRLRKAGGKLKVTDEAYALAYAQATGMAEVINKSLKTSLYAEWAQEMLETGTIAPGCELEPERTSFSVQFKTNDTAEAEASDED